jgi:uncharacterized Fe-S center protein
MNITRRGFVKGAAIAAVGAAAVLSAPSILSLGGRGSGSGAGESGGKNMKSKVYFTADISAAGLLKLYDRIKRNIGGRVAIKWHSGEPHGPNIIPVDMVRALQQSIPDSALVETNTLYKGARFTTAEHRKTLETNGWTFCDVDIMDADGAAMIPVAGGRHFTEMSVGKNMLNYDSMVVLTHFKGHAMGGFGGSMKNIAIGCADGKIGKAMQHCSNGKGEPFDINGDELMERMAESAKATADHFSGRIVYINVMRNMSVDCDCAGKGAAPVKARDIGILASDDILAIDQASVDLLYKLPESELHDLKERIESRHGLRQLTYMKELGMGNDEYELIDL